MTPLLIKDITQALESPETIAGMDKAAITRLVEDYPYFAPGRYLQAARRHIVQPFSDDMMTGMQLYKGNWLMFHKFLDDAGKAANSDSYYSTSTTEVDAHMGTAELFEAVSGGNEDIGEDVSVDQANADEYTETEAIHDVIVEEEVYSRRQPEDEYAETEVLEDAHTDVAEEQSYNQEEQIEEVNLSSKTADQDNKEQIIEPLHSTDYFRSEGLNVSSDIPVEMEEHGEVGEDKSLIVVRGFSEWLTLLKRSKEYEQSEEEDKKALKSVWQREKLAAAIEEEDDEDIPEDVFEMAVNSINKENDLISESLADILVKQEKYDEAIEMYGKLSLRNPQKNTYFADKIEAILKQKGS